MKVTQKLSIPRKLVSSKVRNNSEKVSLDSEPRKAKGAVQQETISFSEPLENSASHQSQIVLTQPNQETKLKSSVNSNANTNTPMVMLSEEPASQTAAEHIPGIDDFLSKLLVGQDSAASTKELGTITHSQFNFDKGTEVVSSAQKFIIPVPTFEGKGGGEDLVYPKDAKDDEGNSIAGNPITDWKGEPIGGPGEKGVVFFNHKDQSYQAVKADGNGVIILNQVTDEQGKKLQDKIGQDPSKLSLADFKGALEYAHSDLGVGDQYNSDKSFISSKMNAMEESSTGVPHYGLHRRDDRDVCTAIHVKGKGEFQGPAASGQKFDKDCVLVRQPNSKADDGFSYRLVQPDAFAETYTNKNGSKIDFEEMENQQPKS